VEDFTTGLVFNIAISAFAALVIVAAWRVIEAFLRRRKPAEATVAAVEHKVVAAPQVAATPLVQQRATILDSLHSNVVSCEASLQAQALDQGALNDDDVALACDAMLANLRRKRPWLSPSTAEQIDQVSAFRDELIAAVQTDGSTRNDDTKKRQRISAAIEQMQKAVSTLRAHLESEFRASSGLFHSTSKE
jgi:hypothetical protein